MYSLLEYNREVNYTAAFVYVSSNVRTLRAGNLRLKNW